MVHLCITYWFVDYHFQGFIWHDGCCHSGYLDPGVTISGKEVGAEADTHCNQ